MDSKSKAKENTESKREGYQLDLNKYKPNIEEIKQKNLNSSNMLVTSVNNIIRPEDSIIYNPKNINLLQTKYPIYPLRLTEELINSFNTDTLFFIFFEQNDLVAKEMARKELIKRDWMYNIKFNSFFKLIGDAKTRNENYIQGTFQLFDHEKQWKVKELNDFKFEIKDMRK